jgi:general transcription factor 3C polypeptide 3 (transcription factor C subunit 4)
MQGLAFLSRYRRLSAMDDPLVAEEVEYNFGRAFHGIGVPHLAVKHYEKVLTLVKQRMMEYKDVEDQDVRTYTRPDLLARANRAHNQQAVRQSSMATMASHNLMLIYGSSGSLALVREKSKWLAI